MTIITMLRAFVRFTGVPNAGCSRPPISNHRAQESPEIRSGSALLQPTQGPVGMRADRSGPSQGPADPAPQSPNHVRPTGRWHGYATRTCWAVDKYQSSAQVSARGH